MNYAYWILPKRVNGKLVIKVPTKHIDDIIKYPEKFGETKESVINDYKKHGERVGIEGKAREDIMERILKRGFVRVRFNMRQQRWSVQVYKLDNRMQDNIFEWAHDAIKQKNVSPESMVYIHSLNDDKVRKYKLKDIMYGKSINESITLTTDNDRKTFFDGPDWIEYNSH
jgi:single-stranded DNA-binding protein